MSRIARGCEARQVSDQMSCPTCNLVWDVNDPEPPQCGKDAAAKCLDFTMAGDEQSPPVVTPPGEMLEGCNLSLSDAQTLAGAPGEGLFRFPGGFLAVSERTEPGGVRHTRQFTQYTESGTPVRQTEITTWDPSKTLSRVRLRSEGTWLPWKPGAYPFHTRGTDTGRWSASVRPEGQPIVD